MSSELYLKNFRLFTKPIILLLRDPILHSKPICGNRDWRKHESYYRGWLAGWPAVYDCEVHRVALTLIPLSRLVENGGGKASQGRGRVGVLPWEREVWRYSAAKSKQSGWEKGGGGLR